MSTYQAFLYLNKSVDCELLNRRISVLVGFREHVDEVVVRLSWSLSGECLGDGVVE